MEKNWKEKEKFFVIAYYQDVEKIKRIFHYEKNKKNFSLWKNYFFKKFWKNCSLILFLDKEIIDQNYIDHFNFIIIEDFKNDNIEFSIFDILLSNLGFDYMIFENPVLKLELAKLKNLKNDFNFF